MSGLINASGLITGLDSGRLIEQLLQLERQPITRIRQRIDNLEAQRDATRGLRTQLQTLRNRLQDFRLTDVFSAFTAASSEESVATATVAGANPAIGAFNVNVTQLASATVASSSAAIGAAINPAATLDASGIATAETSGTFTINGKTITVNSATQSLDNVLAAINGSGAGVTATYNATTDRVEIVNTTGGDASVVNLGASDDTSDFLERISVRQATQTTGGGGSTFLTSTRKLGAIDPTGVLNTESFAGGAISAGTFSINGIAISVDPTGDTINDVVSRINGSDAGVDASYDASTDSLRIVSRTLGSRTVRFGAAGDTSNFLSVTNLAAATQAAGNDAQFTVNGGPVLTRNTNEVSDAIGGVTLRLLSTGASTVTVSSDDDAIVEDIEAFIEAFNASLTQIRDVTAQTGALAGDGGIREIENFLRSNIFNQVTGIASEFASLAEIGFSTGDDFNSEAPPTLQLDADAFREALRNDRAGIASLFSNEDGTGIADALFGYVDGITAVTGFLNERAKSNGTYDQQITNLNDSIGRIEDRIAQKELRLRRQFTQLEQLSAGFQNQNNALGTLRSF